MERSGARKRKKSPYRFLLAIPIQLAVNLALFPIGIGVDLLIFDVSEKRQIAEQGYAVGHGFPIFTILLPLAGFAVTAVVVIFSAVMAVGIACRGGRNKNGEEPAPEKEKER